MKGQKLRIVPVHYGTELRVLLGDGPAKVGGSGAGWTSKERPGQAALSSWAGRGPITQEIPIKLDLFAEQQSVEFWIDALRSMAGLNRANFDGLPPTAVKLRGPVSMTGKTWVITDVEEGDDIVRLPRSLDGQVTRWTATLKVMEFIRPDQIRMRRHRRPRNSPTFYVVRKGDTLTRIAQKVYGDRSKWKLIGNAQSPKIRNPRKELKPGRRLRLPGIDLSRGMV